MDEEVIPMGVSSNNLLLVSKLYEVEYIDRRPEVLTYNTIANY